MIALLIAFVVVAAVVAISPWLIGEKGYVLISFNQWTIEGSIVSFVLLILITLFGLFIVYSLIRFVWGWYRNVRHGFFARSKERKQQVLDQALWGVLNDDYALVEQTFRHGKVEPQWQDIKLAMQAKALLKKGEKQTALNTLDEISEQNRTNVANLWLQAGDSTEMLHFLRDACSSKKASDLHLRLYSQLLCQQEKYSALIELLPKLQKKQLLDDNQWQSLFSQLFSSSEPSQLTKHYDALPKSLKEQASNAYLTAMVKAGELSQVEATLQKELKKGHFAQLQHILSQLNQSGSLGLQKAIQGELKKQPEQPDLLLSLAYLAQGNGEHELAAKIFDKVIALQHSLPYPQRAIGSYQATQQAEKALLLLQPPAAS